jgi:hypothetical protein
MRVVKWKRDRSIDLDRKSAGGGRRTMTWMASRESNLNDLSAQLTRAKNSGDLMKAEELCRKKVKLTAQTFGQFDTDYALALCDLAEVLEAQQKFTEALRLRERIANSFKRPNAGPVGVGKQGSPNL